MTTNFGDLFAAHAHLDTPALVDLAAAAGPVTWSYRDIDRACSQIAAGIRDRGLAPGDRVGILSRNRGEYPLVYFGAMRAGCAIVPLNVRLPAEQQRYCIEDAGVRLVFVDGDHEAPGNTVCFDDGDQWAPFLSGPGMPSEPVGPDGVAVHMYTSGSTGRPKGVLLTHAGQGFTFEKYVAAGIVPTGSSTLVAAPLYHKNAAVSIKTTWGSGATAVLMPRFDPRAYLRALVDHGCATVIGVPTMFALMMNEPDLVEQLDLGHVTRVIIGSAPMTDALREEVRAAFPNATITNSYGTTEVIAIFGEHPDGLPRPGISVGYPLPFVDVRLTDEGELWVRSPGGMAGYHGLPEVTAQRLVDGWYRTGDTFRVDADGFYYFVGRVDDMFVCGGENIYPGEVESMLERHPAVHQACVVPVSDRIKGQLPVAFVVATAGETVAPDEVKAFALQHGPAYAHPRHVVMVDELPLAGTAKIDRRRLVDEAEARYGDGG